MSSLADGDAPDGFSVRVENLDVAVVLTVYGDVDLVTAPQLGESISAALDRRPGRVVVDLSEVAFLASAGMSVLIGCRKAAGDDDIEFRLVAAGRTTFRPMELTGVTDEILIFPSREQALAED